ncbi:MAG: alpha/beta fold hydrolase [Rubrobacteraceae bacterium]|nr:alpha/beta fold hydrolase [Rubrobacteraceae bacterium]
MPQDREKEHGDDLRENPRRRHLILLLSTLWPVVLGGAWLWSGARDGVWGVVLGWPPGALLFAAGLSDLLWAGNARIRHFMAFGSLLGTVFAIPYFAVAGPAAAVLLVLSATGFVLTGYASLVQEKLPEGVPQPKIGVKLAARAAEDEASMCYLALTTWPLLTGERARRVSEEAEAALALFDEKGWLARPALYHRTPPPVNEVRVRRRHVRRTAFEQITYESGYEPHPAEPGYERWLSYESNRTACAWVLRHEGEQRPWLVCIPGIRMGSPRLDLSLFEPDYLHRELGLNVLIPVLPTHGPRKIGLISGDRVLSGDIMDTLHAASQALWDIRRITVRLRLEGAPAIGVLGHSLGGYVAALLCGLERDLECVVASNPPSDYPDMFWNAAPSAAVKSLEASGLDERKLALLSRVISPLALDPLLPPERLAIFAGNADRVVPPSQPEQLWRHWGSPRIVWYEGSHQGLLSHPKIREQLPAILSTAGLLEDPS